MDYSTSDCQLNQGEVDFEFESNEVLESLCVVDDQFVPKVGMTFNTLEDAAKFYKDYAKAAGFSTRELTAILHRAYGNIMVEMGELKAKRKGTCLLSHEDANLESINELQSPPRVRTRGRPKNRLGSKLDKQIENVSKKKKTKALNELNLFDAVSVVYPNSSQYQGHVMNYQFRKLAAGDSFLGV
ncbi:hypothetical protein Ahy_A03g014667 [Arachis hypogaea]|uniref:Protein FAR1-RELATED SEQUENCE n=1 Tax=Arachis hypogaea TaxID=3818 RepID=A0A445DYA5_ARAHY|nr:hypothetical protein Ahy_A03g014667 [Arachis hypogaea]